MPPFTNRLDREPHHIELRATLRVYLERNAPNNVINDLDREGIYPEEIVSGLADLGIWGALIREDYGGAGADIVSVAIACEELQRAGACLSSALAPTVTYCARAIEWFGSEDLRQRILPGIAEGRTRMGIGLSEPDAASDLSRVATRADAVEGGFRVVGSKVWCTGAAVASHIVTLARTDRERSGFGGLSLLLVPTDDPNVTIRKTQKLAGGAAASCEVFFDGAFVPDDHLLGELHGAGTILWSLLDSERVFVAAQCVGIAQGALDVALDYARSREQFGKPIIEHQAIAHSLATMAAKTEMARLLAYSAAQMADDGLPYSHQATLAKVACSEAATEVVDLGMEVLGSYSYSVEYPMERYYREVKLYEIAAGTNHILRTVIGKNLARNGTPDAP
jgi:alkylation response protein AidB-like acyl-CoA dehydrogenase